MAVLQYGCFPHCCQVYNTLSLGWWLLERTILASDPMRYSFWVLLTRSFTVLHPASFMMLPESHMELADHLRRQYSVPYSCWAILEGRCYCSPLVLLWQNEVPCCWRRNQCLDAQQQHIWMPGKTRCLLACNICGSEMTPRQSCDEVCSCRCKRRELMPCLKIPEASATAGAWHVSCSSSSQLASLRVHSETADACWNAAFRPSCFGKHRRIINKCGTGARVKKQVSFCKSSGRLQTVLFMTL